MLALWVGHQRLSNPFYKVLQIITGPVVKAARFLSPRCIPDAHVTLLALFLLFCLWILLALLKRRLCGLHGLTC